MKRNFNCSDSLTHFLSHPLEDEMKGEEDCIYKDAEIDEETAGAAGGEKKRRLSNHQVKSLEKIFEVDNKLDPDRKVKVAQDLGLQPRQVAIWFQNRRARWKTKQLERDYNLLKSNYDLLKHNYHKLEQDNQSLTKQLEELKSKLHEETTEGEEDEGDYDDESKYNRDNVVFSGSDPSNTNHEVYTRLLNYEKSSQVEIKDGLSDSDSSGVLNDTEINMNLSSNSNSSSNGGIMASFGVSNSSLMDHGAGVYEQQQQQQQQSDPYSVGDDESCNIFLVDQAPNLCWYFRDHLN